MNTEITLKALFCCKELASFLCQNHYQNNFEMIVKWLYYRKQNITNQCNGTKQRKYGEIAYEAGINVYSIFTYLCRK